jgi:hypothetical membrane protein
MEEKRKKLGQDDDGQLDDKRVAGWILFIATLALAVFGVFKDSTTSVELVRVLIWPAMALLGIGVAEKFRKKV